jgi:GT2 family glycosyltransferase
MNIDRIIMPAWLIASDLVNLTENAINSLRENDVKITIIDNGSTMGSGALREWADEYVRVKVNNNYAPAVNQGLKLHMGEIVAIANNDIRVSKNWKEVAERIMEDQEVCSVHFRMIPYDQPFDPGTETSKGGRERWCSSSFFVVRAEQLYDEELKNSYDDYDYWYRWRKRGFKQCYTNLAEYQHLDSSTVQRMPEHNETNAKNYEYYKKKHGEYPDVQFAKDFPDQVKLPWKPFW